MRGIGFTCILFFAFWGRATNIQPPESLGSCEYLYSELSRSRDIQAMNDCADLYYYEKDQHDEPKGSFNRIIQFYLRIVDVDPNQKEFYNLAATLMIWKWSLWKSEPARMPDGRDKLGNAIDIMERGKLIFARDPKYLWDYALLMWGTAQHHNHALYVLVIDNLKDADRYSNDCPFKTRIRMTLGRVYVETNQISLAIQAYRAAEALDPQNPIILRILTNLTSPAKGPNGTMLVVR